ncbi:MAG: MurT ligase domain-containing protein [Bifidobacteriaceae bacterium]|jgi:UDP-N-acetylmuramyl tripeptide synthase|nr:MurT ligase domain-containing protein [Bifidobacteriaceae bacterium]
MTVRVGADAADGRATRGWRITLVIAIGRLVAAMSRMLGRGRGHVVGGRVMVALRPHIVAELSRGKQLTLVSATNGKSTTTRLIAEAMRTRGPVAHNATGANMAPGVASALADGRAAGAGALEVDEAHLPALAAETQAGVVVLMNLSRDQLDRGAEVSRLAARWRTMVEQADWPLTVVGNADDPLVTWACLPGRDVCWVAAGQRWRDDSVLCPACTHTLRHDGADWHCPHCELRRPRPAWSIEGSAIVPPDGRQYPVHLRLPGRVNVANAAMAAAAVETWGVAPDAAVAAFERVEDVDGRYVEATVDGRRIRLLLGKNPASWTELIDMVTDAARPLVVAINARGADGRDPSWLWDVPFELLAGRDAWATGERRFDLAVRLSVAGVTVVGVTADPLAAAAEAARGGAVEAVDMVANYTAFQAVRARVVL